MQNIEVVARRGINNAAFTTKEIRDISKIPNLKMYVMKDEVQRAMTTDGEYKQDTNVSRAVGRRTEFLHKTCQVIEN